MDLRLIEFAATSLVNSSPFLAAPFVEAAWFVVICRQGKQSAALEHLAEKGIVAYAPRYERKERVNDKRKRRRVAYLFGRRPYREVEVYCWKQYLVVRFNEKNWNQVRRIPEIRDVLRSTKFDQRAKVDVLDKPVLVKDEVVMWWKRQEGPDGFFIGFQPGKVYVRHGPLVDHVGIFVGKSNCGNDIAEFECLCQPIPTHFPPGALAPG
jgi:transcription antitermination factor NusG